MLGRKVSAWGRPLHTLSGIGAMWTPVCVAKPGRQVLEPVPSMPQAGPAGSRAPTRGAG